MNTHIRMWGIALTAVVAFAVPHLITQAVTTTATLAQVIPATPTVQKTLSLKITAYTSEESQTDDTPFITADGSYVHDGVVATNLLPFGTKVTIPSLFGNKIFTVNDRMNKKFSNNLDVWMENRADAIIFGARTAKVMVLQSGAAQVADAAAVANKAGALFSMAIGSKLRGPSVRQL